jgi:hypothetical protein
MHVIDNAANEPRQLDGGACSGNIGTKSGNDRLPATRNNVSRFGYRVVERGRLAANPCLSHARSFGVFRSVFSPPLSLLVVFDVGEACILLWCTFKRSAGFGRLPMNDFFDLFGQLEILVGYSFGGVVLQAHLDPSV